MGEASSQTNSRTSKVKKVLMIAYVFPPFFSVGGSIRVVKFIKYLPGLGWLPRVLTIDDRHEYDTQRKQGSETLFPDIPDEVMIYRTSAGEPSVEFLERGRHAREKSKIAALAINTLRGMRNFARKYLLMPDEYLAWLPIAVRSGRNVIRRDNIDVIFATVPPHSVTLTASLLRWLTRKPLVLDYRDDWIDTPWFKNKPWFKRFIERRLEWWVVRSASRVILVTEYSRDEFIRRYPRQSKDKFVFIPNGVDLVDFSAAKDIPTGHAPGEDFTVVHAGLLSVAGGWHRNPRPLFTALKNLQVQHPELQGKLKMVFTGRLPETYQEMVREMGLSDTVQEVGHLPQPEFIKLLKGSDLLLTINYDGFATLIPGKIYEYWAIGGPSILLLSVPGAASELLDKYGLGLTASQHDADAIADAIYQVYQRREAGEPMHASLDGIEQYDRRTLAEKLAATLDTLS
ncbi:glycosyltransferase [Aggregatilinea lenta]|uniref:glycosyltransferase n=1 Tax=Aggregatilinea lenta TaxID=913108 RepID=UPI000E5B01EA|nr:glycosyltransferase [Aggregatilinea lenta]